MGLPTHTSKKRYFRPKKRFSKPPISKKTVFKTPYFGGFCPLGHFFATFLVAPREAKKCELFSEWPTYHDIIICPHVHHFGPHVPRHATPWLLWKSTATTSGNMNISSSSAEPAPEVSQNLSCVDCPRFLSCHQFIISYNCPHGIIFTHTIPPSPRVWSSATVRCPPWTACRNAALSRRSN